MALYWHRWTAEMNSCSHLLFSCVLKTFVMTTYSHHQTKIQIKCLYLDGILKLNHSELWLEIKTRFILALGCDACRLI